MEAQGVSAGQADRRQLFRLAAGAVAASVALAAPRQASAQTVGDVDLLNFILNLQYLQAQFFSYVSTGAGLAPTLLTGSGAPGAVTPGRAVTLSATGVASSFLEIANDTRLQLTPVRVILGAPAVAQPAINISADSTGPFTVAMQRAGVVSAGATFDPYASEENLLYAAYFLKDLGVSVYRGVLPTVSNRVVVQLLSGILATESHHASVIRQLLYLRGATVARYRQNAANISTLRRTLGGGAAIEQGVSPTARTYAASNGTATVQVANLTPADTSGETQGRTPGQALNLLYLSSAATTQGGFFPSGVNGTIRTSAGV